MRWVDGRAYVEGIYSLRWTSHQKSTRKIWYISSKVTPWNSPRVILKEWKSEKALRPVEKVELVGDEVRMLVSSLWKRSQALAELAQFLGWKFPPETICPLPELDVVGRGYSVSPCYESNAVTHDKCIGNDSWGQNVCNDRVYKWFVYVTKD